MAEARDGLEASLIKLEHAVPIAGPMLEAHPATLLLRAFEEGNAKADDKLHRARDILHALLPPRKTSRTVEDANGRTLRESWVQFPSATPADRSDVMALEVALEAALKQRQARQKGICPVKEELLSEAVDELLRQIALDCPERGLLLLRVRDELRMSISAYRNVYESSIAFGGRKASESAQELVGLAGEAAALEREVHSLQVSRAEWECRAKLAAKEAEVARETAALRRREEVLAIKAQTESFSKFLEQQKEEL